MATRAKAMTMPTQPTPQEIQEHNITHMPYRSWCPSCVQAKAGKQITRSRHRGSQSCKLISPTSPVLVTSFPHRYLQQSTYKQAWQWQQRLQTSTISSATRRPVYKHSSLSVAGQKAFYKATMRST